MHNVLAASHDTDPHPIKPLLIHENIRKDFGAYIFSCCKEKKQALGSAHPIYINESIVIKMYTTPKVFLQPSCW